MILHFTNARLIDPEAGVEVDGTLTIQDGVIVARDAEPPEGAEIVDCQGRCLVPGIIDWGVKVGEPGERAALLALGCAEALPASVGLRELAARARRVDEMFGLLPRWRELGPLTLDLFHRDARHGHRWLHLHPREFGVLWRLSDTPGQRVTRRDLLEDVWRLSHDPQTNSVEVHISRLRAKLAAAGCAHLVATVPEGGYRLTSDQPLMFARQPAEADALDRYVRTIGWPPAPRRQERNNQGNSLANEQSPLA